jgi:hypothetical protein
MTGKTLALGLALLFAGSLVFAADTKADSRVSKSLDKLGLKYSTTTSGNFSLLQKLDNDRSQTVYIMSKTETYGGLEIREVWSNAGSFESEPTAEQMMQLLEDNNTEKIGAWNIESSDDGSYLAYFSIKVPTYLKDKDLSDMIDFAATVGDEMEAKLFDNADDN